MVAGRRAVQRVLPLVLAAATVTAAAGHFPGPAAAHLGSTKYLTVERTTDGARVQVDIDVVDAAVALGLAPDTPTARVVERAEQVGEWLAAGIHLRAGERACAPEAQAPRPVERSDGAYLSVILRYRCPSGADALVLRDDTVFSTDPQHEAIVHTRIAGSSDAAVLRRGDRALRLEAPLGPLGLMGRFLWQGVLHLVTGYDHVLFLLSLILTAGFVAVGRGFRKALRDVAIVVTAFTVGHSVTLIAAALQVVVLPSRLVESVIAASIVAVAAINILRPERRGPMPWLAFAFGLIHGFGFSSVLVELGLPSDQTVLALLSFNVGIELAQLAFVTLALGPIAWAAHLRGYRDVVVRGGSAVIALLGLVWLVERAWYGVG